MALNLILLEVFKNDIFISAGVGNFSGSGLTLISVEADKVVPLTENVTTTPLVSIAFAVTVTVPSMPFKAVVESDTTPGLLTETVTSVFVASTGDIA